MSIFNIRTECAKKMEAIFEEGLVHCYVLKDGVYVIRRKIDNLIVNVIPFDEYHRQRGDLNARHNTNVPVTVEKCYFMTVCHIAVHVRDTIRSTIKTKTEYHESYSSWHDSLKGRQYMLVDLP